MHSRDFMSGFLFRSILWVSVAAALLSSPARSETTKVTFLLMSDMYDEGFDAAELLGGDDAMRDRVATAIRTIFVGWGQRTHLYRAMLDARAASTSVRDQFDSFQESFVGVVAGVIDDERAAGRALAGVDATALATALLDLNDRTLERLVHAPPGFDWDKHVEAVVHIWLSSIYGRTA